MGCGSSSSLAAVDAEQRRKSENSGVETLRLLKQKANEATIGKERLSSLTQRHSMPGSTTQHGSDFRIPVLPTMQAAPGSCEESESSFAALAQNLKAHSLATARRNPLLPLGSSARANPPSVSARKPIFMQSESHSDVAEFGPPTEASTLPRGDSGRAEFGVLRLAAASLASRGSSLAEGCFSLHSRDQVSELTANGALLLSPTHNAASASCFSSMRPAADSIPASDAPSRSSSRPTTPRERRADPLFEVASQMSIALRGSFGVADEPSSHEPSSSSLLAVYGGAHDLHHRMPMHNSSRPLGADGHTSTSTLLRRGRSLTAAGAQLFVASSTSIGSCMTATVDYMHFVARPDSQAPTLRDLSSCKDVLWSSCGSAAPVATNGGGKPDEIFSGQPLFVMGMVRFTVTAE